MSTVADRRVMELETHTLAFLKALEAQGGSPLYTLSPTDARAVFTSIQTSVSITKPAADSEDRTISGGPTSEISLRVVRPQGVTGVLP